MRYLYELISVLAGISIILLNLLFLSQILPAISPF